MRVDGPVPGVIAPVVRLGPVATPAARTGLQLISGEFVIQGIEVWGVALTPDQHTWSVVAATVALSWGQNWAERRRGRALIGVAAAI